MQAKLFAGDAMKAEHESKKDDLVLTKPKQDIYRLAPGNVLTNYEIELRIKNFIESKRYLLETGQVHSETNLRKLSPQMLKDMFSFVEVGSGTGFISEMFLKNGFEGMGFDLNSESNEINRDLNREYVYKNHYQVHDVDFFDYDFDGQKFDIVISHMVIEHMDPAAVDAYIDKVKSILKPGGLIMIAVPAGMEFWGIEDEIAGHYKRYELKDLDDLQIRHKLYMDYFAFLTYPISNWLLGLSNFLIAKQESHKLGRSMEENTVESSNRHVQYKTEYPGFFKFLINKITLYPFIILQNLSKHKPKGMVLYAEFKVNT